MPVMPANRNRYNVSLRLIHCVTAQNDNLLNLLPSLFFTADKLIESCLYDSTYLLDVKGIPWTATKWEIVDFFNDLNILNRTDGIHFKLDSHFNNDAYIQLTSLSDYNTALRQKVRYFGNSAVKSTVFLFI